jgi:uncharacterized protein
MSILLDTGAIFAYIHADDVRHDEAVELMGQIAKREFGSPFVTDHVIDEVFVLARARTRSAELEDSLRRFLPLPTPAVRGLAAVSLGTAGLVPSWEMFKKFRDQGLSFTDASLIVAQRELKLDWLATFDRRLASLVPSKP